MVLDPQKGKEAIGADEPVKWFVTTEPAYNDEDVETLLRSGIKGLAVFDALQPALDEAIHGSIQGASES